MNTKVLTSNEEILNTQTTKSKDKTKNPVLLENIKDFWKKAVTITAILWAMSTEANATSESDFEKSPNFVKKAVNQMFFNNLNIDITQLWLSKDWDYTFILDKWTGPTDWEVTDRDITTLYDSTTWILKINTDFASAWSNVVYIVDWEKLNATIDFYNINISADVDSNWYTKTKIPNSSTIDSIYIWGVLKNLSVIENWEDWNKKIKLTDSDKDKQITIRWPGPTYLLLYKWEWYTNDINATTYNK